MRTFVIIVLLITMSAPLIAFYIIPAGTIIEHLNNHGTFIQGVSLSVEGLKKGFPYLLEFKDALIRYRNRPVLRLNNVSVSLNPYMLITGGLSFSAYAAVDGDKAKVKGIINRDNLKLCIDIPPVSLKGMHLVKHYLGAIKGGFMSLRLCMDGTDRGYGYFELTALKMNDLPYRGAVFPAGRITGITGGFSLNHGVIRIEAMRLNAGGFRAMLYGVIKRRRLRGRLEVYTEGDFSQDELRGFMHNRYSGNIYIIPVNTDIITLFQRTASR